jgi:hypothetical protein
MRRLLLPALALLLAPAAAAQLSLTWTPVTTLDLPASIEVFVADEPSPLFLKAYLVRADPADPSWRLDTGYSTAGRTVAGFAANTPGETLVALNGGYFGGGQSFSLVVQDGATLASNIAQLTRDGLPFYPTRGAFGLDADGTPDVAWIYNVGGTQIRYPAPSPNAPGAPQPRPDAAFPAGGTPWTGLQTAIGGGPVLVENGQVRLTWTEEVFFGGSGVDTTSARARSAIGYDAEGKLLLLAVRESRGVTLREAAEIMRSFGAVEAVNLDGGGSTALWADGAYLLSSARAVVSAVVIRRPSADEGYVFDTGTPGAYRETGAWFESANTPFWGTTPSRLNQVGVGQDSAVFRVSGVEPAFACATVEAWWTPSANRATNTPFAVHSSEGVQVFRVNQADPATAGRWNVVGTVGAIPDSVVVTDDAQGAAVPSFVSVDAIRVIPTACVAAEPGVAPAFPLALAPNPSAGAAAALFETRAPGEVEAVVLDVLGRAVRAERHALPAGPQRLDLHTAGLPPGVYLVRVTTPDGVATRALTVAR